MANLYILAGIPGCGKLDIIQEQETSGSSIGFEYCVYEMPQKECEDICIILQKLGYNTIIGHRLGSESTITVMKE